MGMIATAAYGVDRTHGHYTVYVPPTGARPAKYVVYDKLADAKADVDSHKFGYVFAAAAGKPKQVYKAPAMSTFTAPPGTAKVQLAPPPQKTPQAAHVALAARAAVANPIHTTPAPAPAPARKWGW